MSESENVYVRCKNCSYVYEVTLDKCPMCGADTMISEGEDKEKVFNIID